MRIGVDVDGVLVDTEQFIFDFGGNYFFDKKNIGIKNSDKYHLCDVFGITPEEEWQFWSDNILYYCENLTPRPFAAKVLKELKNMGHEIVILTARYSAFEGDKDKKEKIKSLTKKWFDDNDLYYDEFVFTPTNKYQTCLDNKIDTMIEDSSTHIKNLSKVMPVFCFDAGHNKDCDIDGVLRVFSWHDILLKIKENNFKKPSYKQ